MMKRIRDLRLIPVVLLATVCLLTLKVAGLVVDGGYTLSGLDWSQVVGGFAGQPEGASDTVAVDEQVPARPKSWAQEMFNFGDVTGSIAADKQADKNPDKNAEKKTEKQAKDGGPQPAPPKPAGIVIPPEGKGPASPAERALLERLGERRQELDARSRELEIRENLLKSAERRIDGRVNELKDMETRANGAVQKKDELAAQRFKNLVTMYENMKAKDAAKIFDRLEMRVLAEVASNINPRKMSDILAQMQAENAERLTVELANRATGAESAPPTSDLPKIEGRPRPQAPR